MTIQFIIDHIHKAKAGRTPRAELVCPICHKPQPRELLIIYKSGKVKICRACQAARQRENYHNFQASREKCATHNQWLTRDGNCPACQRSLGAPQEIFGYQHEQPPYIREYRANEQALSLARLLPDWEDY